ncbi:hypothetical protein B5X24_HaOG209760 [Helicoverpa armigera]|uniref:Uncharacterized protein n=1 Tax=Helicoverpa armigera TaxID=29058 RepID=A0A2W1BNL0_HELAM|nr:hypothetical protein B5X24_HaOG209760 [Helicoverpa armigera]
MAPKLRLGNTAELEEFFDYVGPLNRNRRRPPQTRAKKDDPERANLSVEPPPGADLQKEFIKMINKFALSSSSEPDSYITDNSHDYDNTPSMALKIYMKETGRDVRKRDRCKTNDMPVTSRAK